MVTGRMFLEKEVYRRRKMRKNHTQVQLEKKLREYLEKYARWILIVEEIEKIFEKFKN